MSRLSRLLLCSFTAASLSAASVGCGKGQLGNDIRPKQKDFKVYCVHDKIEVDERPLREMLTIRGGNICVMFNQKETQRAAHDEASRLGGIGHRCSTERLEPESPGNYTCKTRSQL